MIPLSSRTSLIGASLVALLAAGLSACGGSGGGSGDTGDIARDESTPLTDPVIGAAMNMEEDDLLACDADFDIAEFVLTESDRQWSCSITSESGVRFDDIHFNRNGTAVFANDGIWYWNRNLPGSEINLSSPTQPSMLMSGIASSNTVLMFDTTTESGVEQFFDCVLVSREVSL